MKNEIRVIDSPPGSGKTSWAIETINKNKKDKILFITPYLTEVERIITSCESKNFEQPNYKAGKGSKLTHFKELLKEGKNIVSTHSLFSRVDDETIEILQDNNYILWLDEVFQTLQKFKIGEYDLKLDDEDEIPDEIGIVDKATANDVKTMINKNIIKVEDDNHVSWVDKSASLTHYLELQKMCESSLIYCINDSVLIWSFPIIVFKLFKEVNILTHRFDSQVQQYYYSYYKVPYTKFSVYRDNGEYKLKSYDINDELKWKKEIKNKIKIVENKKLNDIGKIEKSNKSKKSYANALSKSWCRKNKSTGLKILSKNLESFFVGINKSKAEERLWTCFKSDIDILKTRRLSTEYRIPLNTRATNQWGDRTYIAYPVNRYLDPHFDIFFRSRNIQINQDEFALSEMIQFIWRAGIRNGKEIMIYIPSERMRKLLQNYLKDS